jgi:hypothetical protein
LSTKHFAAVAIVAPVLALQGCATYIKADATTNPAPAEKLSAFGKIEMRPVVYRQGFDGNPGPLAKIQGNLSKSMAPLLEEWNKATPNGRTLVIEPVVEELQFKSTTRRVFLGPFAGSSGVLMKLNIRDGQGKLIAQPQFFQRADALAAGWVLGVHDNLMLWRVSNLATTYLKANYAAAVGGPTGADDRSLTPATAPGA